MASDRQIYGEIGNRTDMEEAFAAIRRDIDQAANRPDLTELYRRASYLITLTHDASWREKSGEDPAQISRMGDDQFRETAQAINRRAAEIGADADFDETWAA